MSASKGITNNFMRAVEWIAVAVFVGLVVLLAVQLLTGGSAQ